MTETSTGPLRLQLADGSSATLTLNTGSTVVAVEEVRVSSYDLAGRPYAVVRDGSTFRRGLDGRLLCKGGVASGSGRVRRRLSAEEGAPALEAARGEAEAVAEAVRGAGGLDPTTRAAAQERLARIAAMDAAALREDARRFASIYRPVGILPPDQYLSILLQATEGCSWNACGFCSLYRETPFRVKSEAEFLEHAEAVRAFLGDAIALRRSLFLGAANALCVAPDRLVPLVETAARLFPVAPAGLAGAPLRAWLRQEPGRVDGLYAFVDALLGSRLSVRELRDYARLGLRRVYLGLETGDAELLGWLGKPGTPGDAVQLALALHEAGIGCGVIALLGAGGERFSGSHVERTAQTLTAMRLGPSDLVYFSELVEVQGLDYAHKAAAEGIVPLGVAALRAQRLAITARLAPADPARPPRVSSYDLHEFVY